MTMPTDSAFGEFLGRIRAGDEDAAAELVRRYEPIIRREVRMRLTDPRLYRQLDSVDICQSVLLSFFVRAALGQYDLKHSGDLHKLLVTMARNKFATQARKIQRQNGSPATALGRLPPEAVVDPHPAAERILADRDLLGQVLGRLAEEERRLANLRAEGCSWPEVAGRLGGSAEARRKQLARALDRVLHTMGLEDLE
jgi:RNA polymerase sigma-70 factor (ECF subfamily)